MPLTVSGRPVGTLPGSPAASPATVVRRHRVVLCLLAAGVALRTAAAVAYWPGLWFYGDSGRYIEKALLLDPQAAAEHANSMGYALFLALFRATDSLAAVTVTQHLLGLAVTVAPYALLHRRGVAPWLAALGVAPLALDAHLIVLEQYILSDSLFLALTVGAVVLLLWRERPDTAAVLAAGTLLGAAVLVRTAGVAVLAVCLGYLAARRVGWARFALTLGAIALPLGAYAAWTVPATGTVSLSGAGERYLYSRTAAIADCSRLELTAAQRELCPAQPLAERPMRGDWYLWNDPNLTQRPPEQDPLIGSFATAVITQQPLDYATLVLRDTGRFLVPGQPVDRATRCLFGWWDFPAKVPQQGRPGARCQALLAQPRFASMFVNPTHNDHPRLRAALAGYSRHVTTPVLAVGVSLLLCLAAAARRGRFADRWDAALPALTGLALIVLSVATSMYEIRYGLTSTALLGVGGALAAHQLAGAVRAARATPPLPASGTDDR